MKKTLLLVIVAACLTYSLKAQDFVVYNGETEKSLISTAQTPNDFMRLALCTELTDAEATVIYNSFSDNLKQLNLATMIADRSAKHIKKVCQAVSEHFLKTYNPVAHFGDFIVNGEYSDICASILYAYVLDSLKIPYQIKQLPAHVYIVANPGADEITFETVDPAKGFYMFNDQSKLDNVNEMIKDGYIEQSFAVRAGVERTFDDFFYSKTDLSLKDAIAVLYFNRVMAEGQANENMAYSDICKADILSPDKRNTFLENRLLLNMANNFKYDNLEEWRALTRLVNNKFAVDNTRQFLEFQFENFLNQKLLNSGEKKKVDEVYNYLHTSIRDTAVKKVITTSYFLVSAQYAYLTNDYEQALNCLEVAYPLKPNSPIIISNLVQMILRKFSQGTFTTESFNAFDKYMESYPLLKGNPVIISIYINYMSVLSMVSFGNGNAATGEKYLQMMIHELDTNPDSESKNHSQVANAFSMASVYYFRKQNKQKAIAILNQGLKYEPDDQGLLMKLKVDSGN